MTGVPRRSVAVRLPVRLLTRTSRICSLQATHAELPSSARVIVGQYGPAPAQALIALAPVRSPAATATRDATIAPASFTLERIGNCIDTIRPSSAHFRPA